MSKKLTPPTAASILAQRQRSDPQEAAAAAGRTIGEAAAVVESMGCMLRPSVLRRVTKELSVDVAGHGVGLSAGEYHEWMSMKVAEIRSAVVATVLGAMAIDTDDTHTSQGDTDGADAGADAPDGMP